MSLRIKSVDADGLGAYLGLKPGDRLLKINGRNVPDPLDYQFRIIDPVPVLELEVNGQRVADLSCAMQSGGLFASMAVVGALLCQLGAGLLASF